MKNQEIRFGISDDLGRRAATWILWTPKDKSDVYLTCRRLGGILKASLHASGSWQFGFTKEAWQNEYGHQIEGKNRHIEVWQRPQPFITGVTLAFRIVTPFSAVKSTIEKDLKRINWIPNCSHGKATQIDIIFTTSSLESGSWPGKNKMDTKLIGSYRTSNGEYVWVVYWEIPLPDLSPLTKNEFRFYTGKTKADLDSNSLRMLAFADNEDGIRTLYDCVIEK